MYRYYVNSIKILNFNSKLYHYMFIHSFKCLLIYYLYDLYGHIKFKKYLV